MTTKAARDPMLAALFPDLPTLTQIADVVSAISKRTAQWH